MIKSIYQTFRCGAIDLHLGWKGFLVGYWRRNPSVAQHQTEGSRYILVRETYDYADIRKGAKKCSSIAEVAPDTCQSCWGFE